MARAKAEDKPKFAVQVNVVTTLHAADEMAAVTTVLREVEDLTIKGCVGRKIKWFGVKGQE